ncbi:MAG: pyridoxal phosphate-dependent aminotransferase [Acidaminococcaceae bacterium]|jgi:cystathionine beta-lyase|nr:pyridoxal phosphate-dependent aminotransferase [Acidaminococcaceae bacterium]
MSIDFDQVIERRGTDCIKYDAAVARGKPEGLLPFWVADMDFKAPDPVLAALRRRVDQGIFGYSDPEPARYFAPLQKWYQSHHDWTPEQNWLVKTPGVVFALATAVKAFTKPGDSVLIQQPVYYPFSAVIINNGRRLVNSPLVLQDGVYHIDFADFEKKIVENQVKLFILCSPHNPVGRVWSAAELRRLGDICLQHQVLVVADEIHDDFVWPGFKHTVYASLGEKYARQAVVCTAPSKTFNLAGLQVSNIFIPDPDLRQKFADEITRVGYSQLNTLGLVACEAAYRDGEAWLTALKAYLLENLNFTRRFLQENLPRIKLIEPQGTYLLWLDFRALGLDEAQREALLLQKAKVWLDSGAMFGKDGDGFERWNITCPRVTLKQGLQALAAAVHKLP